MENWGDRVADIDDPIMSEDYDPDEDDRKEVGICRRLRIDIRQN